MGLLGKQYGGLSGSLARLRCLPEPKHSQYGPLVHGEASVAKFGLQF